MMAALLSSSRTSAISLLRVGSIRFSAYYILGFVVGFGPLSANPLIAILGIAYCVLFCLGVELLNRLSDRHEDAINQPERTSICLTIGYDTIRKACVACWILLTLLGGLMAWLRSTWASVGILLATLIIGASYSVGPALKQRRILSLAALTTALSMPALVGWVMSPVQERASSILTCFALLSLVSISMAGMKDITDIVGDEIRGYRSLWVSVMQTSHSVRVFFLIAVLQTAVVFGAVFIGAVPTTALACLVFPVVEFILLRMAHRVSSRHEKAQLREAMHTVTLALMAICLVAVFPSTQSWLISVFALAWWTVASRYLNWNRELSRETFELLLSDIPNHPRIKYSPRKKKIYHDS